MTTKALTPSSEGTAPSTGATSVSLTFSSQKQESELEWAIGFVGDPDFLHKLTAAMHNGPGCPPTEADILETIRRPQATGWDLLVRFHIILGFTPRWGSEQEPRYKNVPRLLMNAFLASKAIPDNLRFSTWFEQEMGEKGAAASKQEIKSWLTGHQLPTRVKIDAICAVLELPSMDRARLHKACREDRIPDTRPLPDEHLRRKAAASGEGELKYRDDNPEWYQTLAGFPLRLRAALVHRKLLPNVHASHSEVMKALKYLMAPSFELQIDSEGHELQPNEADTTLLATRCGVGRAWLMSGSHQLTPDEAKTLQRVKTERAAIAFFKGD